MVIISDKSKCCGCEACIQVCTKQCISLIQDLEGFYYPKVQEDLCIKCGLCERVCPVVNPYEPHMPVDVLAAINTDDDIRAKSSSGGVFSLLAEKIIGLGGVVFGVEYDSEWQATFNHYENIEGIAKFRGSKYLQARVGDSFAQCKRLLDNDKYVLFSGTQCQIAGLNHFLRKDYPNLISVDFICHGVPSPKVWAKYIAEEKEKVRKREKFITHPLNHAISGSDVLADGREVKIENIAFRDKRLGWKKFSFILTLAMAADEGKINSVSLSHIHSKNPFMKAFLSNLILRPSCYTCPAKGGRSHSDITIADFWGIQKIYPSMDDDKGTSLVLVHTKKGKDFVKDLNMKVAYTTYDYAKSYNPAVEISAKAHPRRNEFFYSLDECKDLHQLIKDTLKQSLWKNVYNRLLTNANRIKHYILSELLPQFPKHI